MSTPQTSEPDALVVLEERLQRVADVINQLKQDKEHLVEELKAAAQESAAAARDAEAAKTGARADRKAAGPDGFSRDELTLLSRSAIYCLSYAVRRTR